MPVIQNLEHFKEKITRRIKNSIFIDYNQCWIWEKSTHPYGYGKLTYNYEGEKFDFLSHRASWIVFRGDIPQGMRVCHNCPNGDNPKCCNPEHLFLGTAKDNTEDLIKKKPYVFNFVGQKNNNVILNDKIVLEMRELKKNKMKVTDIAKKYNIKYFTCLDAVTGRNWKHI